jgi:hypothetical protein
VSVYCAGVLYYEVPVQVDAALQLTAIPTTVSDIEGTALRAVTRLVNLWRDVSRTLSK